MSDRTREEPTGDEDPGAGVPAGSRDPEPGAGTPDIQPGAAARHPEPGAGPHGDRPSAGSHDPEPGAGSQDLEPGKHRSRSGDPTATRKRRGGFWHGVREVGVIAVTALVISFLIKTFVMQAFWIPSGSMENTLVYGDRVMVSKIQAGPMSVERGDVVVFEDPGGWLPDVPRPDRGPFMDAVFTGLEFVGVAPSSQGNHLIKRIVGMPGDTVTCCDQEGRLSVNGQPLDESSYLYPGDEPSHVPFEITVPDDHVWLLGDHRSNSRDSRANDDGSGAEGSVPTDNIVGKAFVLIYPFSNFTWFATPDTYDSVPESTTP